MRRLLLLLPLALVALVCPPAGAQIDLDDIPLPPGIDADDIPMPPGIDPSDVPTPRKQRSVPFKVSLYGVQRYTESGRTSAHDAEHCWDERGTRESRSVVRFSTRRPTRATLTILQGGAAALVWRERRDPPLPVRASFVHDGSLSGERLDCVNEGIGNWTPIPPPEERNCSAEVDHLGFDLSFAPGRLEASPDERAEGPAAPPFEGCPWGDRSGELYGAEGRVRLGELLREDKTEVVLRFRERAPYSDAKTTSLTTSKTTIYVVFKRVR